MTSFRVGKSPPSAGSFLFENKKINDIIICRKYEKVDIKTKDDIIISSRKKEAKRKDKI